MTPPASASASALARAPVIADRSASCSAADGSEALICAPCTSFAPAETSPVEHVAEAVEVSHLRRHLAHDPVAGQPLALAIVVFGMDAHVGRIQIALGDAQLPKAGQD